MNIFLSNSFSKNYKKAKIKDKLVCGLKFDQKVSKKKKKKPREEKPRKYIKPSLA